MFDKRKSMFGSLPIPGIISGYGGGTFDIENGKRVERTPAQGATAAGEMMQGVGDLGPLAKAASSQSMPAPAQMEKPRGGFFGADGIGTTILGSVGDYLMQVNGMQPTFAPSQLLQRQQQLVQQRAQQQRAAEWEDWQRQYEYERANPKPSSAQPYRWESNDGDVYELGATGPQRVFDDPTPKMNFIPDGLGGGQWVSVPTASTTRPTIGAVVPDPRRAGGPTAPQSGGFR